MSHSLDFPPKKCPLPRNQSTSSSTRSHSPSVTYQRYRSVTYRRFLILWRCIKSTWQQPLACLCHFMGFHVLIAHTMCFCCQTVMVRVRNKHLGLAIDTGLQLCDTRDSNCGLLHDSPGLCDPSTTPTFDLMWISSLIHITYLGRFIETWRDL